MSWATSFAEKVQQIREAELKQRLKSSFVAASLESVAFSSMAIAQFVFVATYVGQG
jgi:hypothetical protein